MQISAHASTLIKPAHIQITPGNYYPGQWVIWVNDADPVSNPDTS